MSARDGFHLYRELWLPRSRQEVFDFFADARNLELLTPEFLHFQILTPAPIDMREGARIAYRLRLYGVPLRWESEISAWQPPCRFVDEQRKGPYRRWVHEHRFSDRNGGTLVVDDVGYAVLGGRRVDRLLVRPNLEKIFDFRHQKMIEIFGGGCDPAQHA